MSVMKFSLRPVAFLLALALIVASGCGGGTDKFKAARPAVVDAEAVVMYKGKPVVGATIVLAPVDAKYSAAGITDTSGRAVLQTFSPESGVVPGSYKATVTLQEQVITPVLPEGVHADDVKLPKPKSLIPEKYSSFDKAALIVTVPEQGNKDIKFELED
jgi:hypothetical protein